MGFIPKPSEAIEQGGLLQDVDVRIVKSTYSVFDFNGHGTKDENNPTGANMALTITIRPLTATDESEDETQHYVGAWISKLCPSEDNETPLTEVGQEGPYIVLAEGSTATGILKSSSMMLFLKELVNAQFPEDKIGEKASFLEGLEGHYIRKPLKKKDGSDSLNAKTGRANTMGVFNRILKFPWDKKGAVASKTTATAKAAAPKAGATAKSSLSAEELALKFLGEAIPSASSPSTPADLKKSGFGWALKQSPAPDAATRKAMCDLLISDEWLAANSADANPDGVYTFDGVSLTSIAA